MPHDKLSFPIHFANQEYILELLKQYQEAPDTLDHEWVAFFQGMEFASSKAPTVVGGGSPLIDLYRSMGHLVAKHNPMELGDGELGVSGDPVVIDQLKNVYCGTISYEYAYVTKPEIRDFIDAKVAEPFTLSESDVRFVVKELYKAKRLEDFLQKKFMGMKRFSLEGSEVFIPMMRELLALAVQSGVSTAVIGMAHRGRLNVLCNLLGKPYSLLMHEFNAKSLPQAGEGLGDVKYHKGYSAEVEAKPGKRLKVILSANPSHLESVDPVVVGLARAKQKTGGKTIPILIHGDAALAGQGVVYETLQLSGVEGYSVGGAIHIVINNQVGFTASAKETRSTRYCTDIAKAFGMPVIHVNAEDPVNCMRAVHIAFAVFEKFGIDTFIDLNCHRLWGHNETDEPMFTNPTLYQTIKAKENAYQLFVKSQTTLNSSDIEAIEKTFDAELERAYKDAEQFSEEVKKLTKEAVEPVESEVNTALPAEAIQKLRDKISMIPAEFKAHPKIRKLFEGRREGKMIDWATAEALSMASLLEKGVHVRLSGQDSRRGTFSHRHAVLYDQERPHTYIPLAKLGPFEVYNSVLSEFAVMGYEFGYSLGFAKALVIWEAQYGDFVNGAQIVIDQYLAGSESKWGRISNLTLLLPHGFEGQGPEHSSCRYERFLQLSGGENWRVVFPSTPAQLFHLLRRQVLHPKKKPLIVMTPKSMLRFAPSFSPVTDFTDHSFQEVLIDEVKKPRRVILCTGKIYYELKERAGEEIAFVRIEELYPFPAEKLEGVKGMAKEYYWVQEEPINQGAWEYIQPHLRKLLGEKAALKYVGRPRRNIPDTGFKALYDQEQKAIIDEAIGEE